MQRKKSELIIMSLSQFIYQNLKEKLFKNTWELEFRIRSFVTLYVSFINRQLVAGGKWRKEKGVFNVLDYSKFWAWICAL